MFGLSILVKADGRSAAERRRAVRFPMERELRYRVLTRQLGHSEGGGTTINMSSRGILFSTDETLRPGKRLELAISWPVRLENGCALKLITRGRVVRVDQGLAALEIQQYDFRTMGSTGLSI